MRLIDANKLVEEIVKVRNEIPLRVPCAPYELSDYKPYSAGQNQRGGIRKALRCIAEAPPIEAEPVMHGKWEWWSGDNYKCSNCGDITAVDECMEKPIYLYCPNCGAKMDLDVKE